jgi:hypothetical protein
MKKQTLITISILLVAPLLGVALQAPQYLSVSGFNKCLGTINNGTSQSLCLPENKPESCNTESWEELKNNEDNLPYCAENTK